MATIDGKVADPHISRPLLWW